MNDALQNFSEDLSIVRNRVFDEIAIGDAATIKRTLKVESAALCKMAERGQILEGAASAGIVIGAKVPIILTSRADSRESRIASCAIALLLTQHQPKAAPCTI